jgi:hypothetical protein
MNKLLKTIAVAGAGLMLAANVTFAATTVAVTSSNTQGWTTADTRPGGAVNYVADATSPDGGNGALQLTTDASTTAKAQYMHEAGIPLSEVTELSYYNKTVSGPVFAAASYQLPVDLNGSAAGGFTTFVYEPYQQTDPLVQGTWQQWDVDAGQMWSSRSFTDGGTCTVVAGGGGAPFYTLSGIQAACPDAVALGFGVNIGSNNPSYDVFTDLVTFNGTTYDFVYTNVPTGKNACKQGGWQSLTDGEGNPFKNQGQCVSYTNHN